MFSVLLSIFIFIKPNLYNSVRGKGKNTIVHTYITRFLQLHWVLTFIRPFAFPGIVGEEYMHALFSYGGMI